MNQEYPPWRRTMESVIKISWRGDQSEIMRAIESVKPDDSDSFTIEYAKAERIFSQQSQ